MRIYFDHNATTPVDPEVAEAVSQILYNDYGNPSSVHTFGQRAKEVTEKARSAVAVLIGGDPSEIIFTSGGTESNNLALRGGTEMRGTTSHRHLITSAIEHESILNTFKSLNRKGWKTTLLPVGPNGLLSPERLIEAINDETSIVSVMHANNEIGTVQPIIELAEVAHRHSALFHTDAVQSVGKIPVNVRTLGVDLLSISAHKFNGPKGVGVLWIRKGTRLTALLTGGRQERNRRPGTENVPGIVGLGVAAQLATRKLATEMSRIAALRDRLELSIMSRVPGTTINGDREQRVPNTSNISFEGIEAESLLIALDLEGVAVSTGSACSSGTLEPSHVLKAMGFQAHRTRNSIRFSLGANNTEQEVDRLISLLPKVVEKLRKLIRQTA